MTNQETGDVAVSKIAVDVAPVLNSEDDDCDFAVIDGVDDDVVFSGVDAAEVRISDELSRSGMAWIFGKQVNPSLDAFEDVRREISDGATGGIGEDDLEGHL
jgi:hypothetical protein